MIYVSAARLLPQFKENAPSVGVIFGIYCNKFPWPKDLIHNILNLKQNVWMASSPRSPWKATMSYHCVTEQTFIPKEREGEGKEKIQSTCFLNGEVLEVRAGFHTETMARVHPAARSLLLSLPVPRRLSICLWAETHGTSCSTQHISQKFTSCSSALLPSPRLYSQDTH